MHSAAGGMRQRLYPGAAIVRSRARKDEAISLPKILVPVCYRGYTEGNLAFHSKRFKSGLKAFGLRAPILLGHSGRPLSPHRSPREALNKSHMAGGIAA